MGCVFDKPPNESKGPNIFKVYNVDGSGNNQFPASFEVTSDELSLYIEGNDPITWPIRTVKRYGFEGDLFSIEAGRRSNTGAGVFMFRCEQAEQLFRLLQANIQRSSNSASISNNPVLQQRSSIESPNDYWIPASSCRNIRLGSESSVSTYPPPLPQTSTISPQTPETLSPATVAAMQFALSPVDCIKNTGSSPVSPDDHLYINVSQRSEYEKDVQEQLLHTNSSRFYLPPLLTILPSDGEFIPGERTLDRLQYVTIDTASRRSPNTPAPSVPTLEDCFSSSSSSYTVIDLQKTKALSESKRPSRTVDEGARVTRINSSVISQGTNKFGR